MASSSGTRACKLMVDTVNILFETLESGVDNFQYDAGKR